MASPNIVVLTQENFASEVLQSTTPVLVDFWAEWCGPCKAITPILGELADEYENRVKIGKVNIDEQQGLASEYGIRAIPTLLLFDKGQVADQIVGLRSKRREVECTERLLDRGLVVRVPAEQRARVRITAEHHVIAHAAPEFLVLALQQDAQTAAKFAP